MRLFTLKDVTYPIEDELGGKYICGVDEAGRGALAGPVVVASVILPPEYRNPLIIDSKKLSPSKRKELSELIKTLAIDYFIAEVSESEIDRINILEATKRGMALAIEGLNHFFDICFVDGNQLPNTKGYNIKRLIKGDSLSLNVAAASILAKVFRDEKMEYLASIYPDYEFEKNKGYGTKRHLELLRLNGISPIHRRSFSPVRKVLNAGKIYEQRKNY